MQILRKDEVWGYSIQDFLQENICKALPRGRRQEEEFLGPRDASQKYQTPLRLSQDCFDRDT